MKEAVQEPTTAYTLKAKNTKVVLEFTYDLNNVLKSFKIREGVLDEKQVKWLFHNSIFPYQEAKIKLWKEQYKKDFDFIIGLPDLSFDTFWDLYNYKIGKIEARKQWNKLSERDKIEAIKNIKAYDGYLSRKHYNKLHPERYIKKRAFENQYNSY